MDRLSFDSNRSAFQIERRTVKLELNSTVLRSIEAPTAPLIDAETLRAKVREWVKGVFEKQGIEYEEMTPEEAQKRLEHDQSPEKVSKRILDFVKGFANGSPDRAQLLRDAVERGYEQATEAWGGELPEVTQETMKLVREGLDKLFKKVDVQA